MMPMLILYRRHPNRVDIASRMERPVDQRRLKLPIALELRINSVDCNENHLYIPKRFHDIQYMYDTRTFTKYLYAASDENFILSAASQINLNYDQTNQTHAYKKYRHIQTRT